MSRVLLEAPVYSLQAALEAAKFGIDRLELCTSFAEGGETPSAGMLRVLKSEVDVPVFVMIRPRGGDFVYSQKELIVMKQDIQLLGELGADGFVFGILDERGKVDQSACQMLLRAAGDKPCTFHRAFDACSDMNIALEEIIDLGFQRILTSGGENALTEGLTVVQDLLQRAKDRIIIMPGGGTKAEHVPVLKQSGYLREIHSSCKMATPSPNQYINTGLSFSTQPLDFSLRMGIDPDLVRGYKEVL